MYSPIRQRFATPIDYQPLTDVPYFTRVRIFPVKKYTEMTKTEKVQACYQHASLLYERGQELTNQSLRECLNMPKNNAAGASRIIADTVEDGLIKPSNKPLESKKFSSYVPYYAQCLSAYLVSADTDLIPPIDFILNNFPYKKVKVYFPPANHSFDINGYMRVHRSSVIRLESNMVKFTNAVMPDTVTAGGKTYTIPENWKP